MEKITRKIELKEYSLNLPNLITLLRIFLIPVFIILYIDPTQNRSLIAAIIFAFAAITDFVDGYIARKTGQVTKLGKLLDPIADKLLTISGLILLVDHQKVAGWIAILIISREIAVTGLRAIASSSGRIMQAESAGKIKMAILTIAIILLMLDYRETGGVLLLTALFLSLYSGVQYFKLFWKDYDRQ